MSRTTTLLCAAALALASCVQAADELPDFVSKVQLHNVGGAEPTADIGGDEPLQLVDPGPELLGRHVGVGQKTDRVLGPAGGRGGGERDRVAPPVRARIDDHVQAADGSERHDRSSPAATGAGVESPAATLSEVGSVDSICDQLVERRETYGISYVTFAGRTVDAVAPSRDGSRIGDIEADGVAGTAKSIGADHAVASPVASSSTARTNQA